MPAHGTFDPLGSPVAAASIVIFSGVTFISGTARWIPAMTTQSAGSRPDSILLHLVVLLVYACGAYFVALVLTRRRLLK